MNNVINSFFDSIQSDRFYYYGLSIILVVLYHSNCFGFDIFLFRPFKAAYIGVDIFMFFSAYGCCYSFEKNKLHIFYGRRLRKIYPTYLFFAVFISVCTEIGGGNLSLYDWICNLSLLWYTGIGGIYIEWYMTAILILYFLFPLFYNISIKADLMGFLIVIVFCVILLLNVNMEWWHKTIIGRIPMYYAGCLLFFNHRKSQKVEKELDVFYFFLKWFTILILALLLIFIYHVKGFISVDLGAPFLMFLFFFISLVIHKYNTLYSFLQLCGKYSLQIFAANGLTLYILNQSKLDVLGSYFFYFLLTVLLSFFFAQYDLCVNWLLNKIMRTR